MLENDVKRENYSKAISRINTGFNEILRELSTPSNAGSL